MKTHCKQGHEFVPDNVFYKKLTSGYTVRGCRRCRALQDTKRYYTNPAYQAKKRATENLRNWTKRQKGMSAMVGGGSAD
jgi:hypothetical protein